MTDLIGLVISDWGTSGSVDKHYGGTPVYASGNCFNESGQKDIFAFGQIAAELYLEQSGKLTKNKIHTFVTIFFVKIKKTGWH